MNAMVTIDGSQGEGGGQVLRTSLALSILTGQPLQIHHIRANRSTPGLKAQHLQAVKAAAAVSQAEVDGAVLNASAFFFRPGGIRSGRYLFDIGTAGAATLVLQTIFCPLSQASAASTLAIRGGTHVPWSPAFHFLDLQWLPYMRQAGFTAQVNLDTAGFYPRGGGQITATLRPSPQITSLDLTRRGDLLRIHGLSGVANLDLDIASRQKRRAQHRLENLGVEVHLKNVQLPSPGKGTFLLLIAEFEHSRAAYCTLGALGKPAERVADEAVDALEDFMHTGAAIDQFLADQLLLPLSLAKGPSSLFTCAVTPHLQTNARVIEAFLPVKITIQGELGSPGMVTIDPSGAGNGA